MFFGRKYLPSSVICFIFIFINTILIVFAQKKKDCLMLSYGFRHVVSFGVQNCGHPSRKKKVKKKTLKLILVVMH